MQPNHMHQHSLPGQPLMGQPQQLAPGMAPGNILSPLSSDKRTRGRPRKNPPPEPRDPNIPKRKRGRPPKLDKDGIPARLSQAANKADNNKKRGRPKKPKDGITVGNVGIDVTSGIEHLHQDMSLMVANNSGVHTHEHHGEEEVGDYGDTEGDSKKRGRSKKDDTTTADGTNAGKFALDNKPFNAEPHIDFQPNFSLFH
eukprot:gene14793-17487_t